MRLRPLTRLRLGFLALGAILLAPLGFLMSTVDDRLRAQQQLRHEVVAERIFDELERELTAVLESESARPSSAYDEATRIGAWAPFVIGYFKTGANGTALLADDQLSDERRQRLTAAVENLERAKSKPVAQAPKRPPVTEFTPHSSVDVLRKLNRSQEERNRPTPKGSMSLRNDDPMRRY